MSDDRLENIETKLDPQAKALDEIKTTLATMTFNLANWCWLRPLALMALGGLKIAAKRTDAVWDDRIVTLLTVLVKASRGKMGGILDGIRGK